MRNVRVAVVLTLMLTLFIGVNAFAGEVLDRIVKRGELIVGTSADQVPFSVKTKSGKIVGLDADIAKLMAGAMGVKLKLVGMPFSQLLPALEAGKVDIVLSGLTITPQRNLKFAFIGPYYVSGKGILTKRKTLAMMKDPSEMNRSEFKMVALKGSTSQLFVENAIPKAKFTAVSTLKEGVDMLIKGKVGGLVADYPYCVITASRFQDKGLVSGEAKLTYEPLGFAIPGNDLLFFNWVDNFLGRAEGSGALTAVRKRWFKPGPWLKDIQ